MTRSLCTLILSWTVLAAGAGYASDHIKSLNAPPSASALTGDFVFVVAGDNRPTAKDAPLPRVLTTIMSEIRVIRPDLVLWTGDTVYGYNDTPGELKEEYKRFADLAKTADVPIFDAPGNHEIHGEKPCATEDSEKQFVDRFGSLYDSFEYLDRKSVV